MFFAVYIFISAKRFLAYFYRHLAEKISPRVGFIWPVHDVSRRITPTISLRCDLCSRAIYFYDRYHVTFISTHVETQRPDLILKLMKPIKLPEIRHRLK